MATSIIAAQKGSVVAAPFDVRDSSYALMSGQAANVTKTLRDPDTGAVASETVTIAESGSSGYYRWSFTPTKGGMPPKNYLLQLEEPVGSRGQILNWLIQSYDALPAIAGPTSNLTTLANLKEHLRIPDAGEDAYLTNLIARVSEWIKRETRRVLTQTTLTEIHDGRGRPAFRLRDWPVISFTTLHEDPECVYGANALVDATEYVVDARLGEVIRKFSVPFLRYAQSLRAVYVAGYATIPLDLEMAAIELCALKWRRRKNEGLSSRSLQDGSVTYFTASDYTKDVQRVLNLYRNLRVAA